MKKTLFLLDAMALIYRSYFAFSKNPILNSKGQNTSASYGFTNVLLDLLSKYKPTHFAVAFDLHQPTFRHKLYPEYKANREKQPEELTTNLPFIREIIEALNIPVFEHPEYEADDIIGTIAKKAEEEGFQTYMVTTDKDYAQLVSENIFILKPPSPFTKGFQVLGIPEVLKKFEIERVEQVIDYLALMGDRVDNIPGIPGVGAKTASKYLNTFSTMENLLDNLHQLSGKAKDNLQKNIENGILSKKLATIITDVPATFDESQLLFGGYQEERLREIFSALEFKSLANRFFSFLKPKPATYSTGVNKQTSLFDDFETEMKEVPQQKYDSIENISHQYHLVDTAHDIFELANKLSKLKEFSFDTETTHIDPIHASIVGISFCFQNHEAYYIPLDENNAEKRLQALTAALTDKNILKIGQNIKYDWLVLKNYNIQTEGPFFDTMIAQYLITPEGKHNLNYLSRLYLNYDPIDIDTLIDGKKVIDMKSVPIEKIVDYAAEDADVTFQLKKVIAKKLDKATFNLLEKVEFPLIKVLALMEHEGININQEQLSDYSKTLQKNASELQKEIFAIAQCDFNIGSPKQLGTILFEKLKLLKDPKKTKTGQYATGENVLIKLKDKNPIIDKILDFRQCLKLKNTYVDALPRMIFPKDQRVHTNFSQVVVATGRLSSNHPNLQNIPIRTPRGQLVRQAFIPRNEDYVLLSADYSQMELRIMASFAVDESMIDAFSKGVDIHRSTASKIFGVAIDEVSKEQRNVAKTANFGIIYGISSFGLSEQLDISRKDASEIINNYFAVFPKIKQYMDSIIDKAKAQGYVETLMKRRRYLRDINSRNNTQQKFAERNAINAPIQGTAADITKMAMIVINQWLDKNNMKSKMLLQVHDELVFDVYKEELPLFMENLPHLMRDVSNLVVPMEVEIGVGTNWLEAH